MTTRDHCVAGDWVEIERVMLEPADRGSSLPPETADKPLTVWVKGFAQASAMLGDEATIETMTGRLVTGRLSAVLPGYTHTFGQPIAELTHVGADLRVRLAAWRRGSRGVPAGVTDCVDTICYRSDNPPGGAGATAEDSNPAAPTVRGDAR